MKKVSNYSLAAFAVLLFSVAASAQVKKSDGEDHLHQRIALIVAHAYVSSLNDATHKKNNFIVPSLGANYELWFDSKWAVGLHSDVAMTSFEIEKKGDDESIKKEYPILFSLVVVYKPSEHWNVFAGPAKEFVQRENTNVFKTGVEYGVQLAKKLEISFGFDYDIKIKDYNSWLIGIGISKSF